MKKFIVVFLCLLCLALHGCTTPPQEAPASTPQDDIEKAPDYGSVFARTDAGDFYSYTDGANTIITHTDMQAASEVAVLDGSWRFSLCKPTESYDYLLFDGYKETAQGYRGSVFMYVKETKAFTALLDAPTSNAVILPTEDENYADLAWVVLLEENAPALVPVNLRDGSIEAGQIVPLTETEYTVEGENVLPSLKVSDEKPLQIRIENKTYENSSVLSTVAYIYDFEENKLTKITEEDE